MFFGIAEGAVPMNGFRFEHTIEDIQALNRRALTGELDMTAISAAGYPVLADRYAIASVGSSVGRGYGPLIISPKAQDPADLLGARVAVPGTLTTASLLTRLAIPDCIPVEIPFDQVPQAVLDGKVEAGVVIHEWQLTYRDAGLLPVLDLGVWWHTQTKLPLPLGLNVIKQSLGRKTGERIVTILRDSILYALSHQEQALAYAMRYGRGTDPVRARQFIGMYVNEETLSLTEPCRQALGELFRRAQAAGLIEHAPRLTIIDPST